MKVTNENGDLHIAVPLREPERSKSGKTLVVATSNGFVKTTVIINGQPVMVSVNAYIKA
jgi:hypothetical protein